MTIMKKTTGITISIIIMLSTELEDGEGDTVEMDVDGELVEVDVELVDVVVEPVEVDVEPEVVEGEVEGVEVPEQ